MASTNARTAPGVYVPTAPTLSPQWSSVKPFVLTSGNLDESPSFAPNGKYIMYATETARRKSLAVVSVDGRVKQRLTAQAGNIKEPTWGPFMQ